MSVERFVIDENPRRCQKLLIRACRRYIERHLVRVTLISSVILSVILAFIGYMRINVIAVLLSVLCCFVLTVCLFSVSDIKIRKMPIGLLTAISIYLTLVGSMYSSIEEISQIPGIGILLDGINLIEYLKYDNLHNISLRPDGILNFIIKRGNSYDIPMAYKVDMSLINPTVDRVDIVADACNIKAIPFTN